VVEVVVGDQHVADLFRHPAQVADGAGDAVRPLRQAGVDEDQPLAGLDDVRVDVALEDPVHPLRDPLGLHRAEPYRYRTGR